MSNSMKKRTLDAFFKPPIKKVKIEDGTVQNEKQKSPVQDQALEYSHHTTYPFPIPFFPESISESLSSLPSSIGKAINDQADLDLLYFQPYIPKYLERQGFPIPSCTFYRVEYTIKRGGMETQVQTPRYTTVFGLDETSKFNEDGSVVDTKTVKKVENDKIYSKYPPRPIPKCLNDLRTSTEAATGCKFNFCLTNYYASGADSISYHSDDERFLGHLPSIASFSLRAKRDFLMKRKPIELYEDSPTPPETNPIKPILAGGDMILMRGQTQANWLHSIPKRTAKNTEDGGRINITFRRAMVIAGTENYYNYHVGTGPVYKWEESRREMRLWKA